MRRDKTAADGVINRAFGRSAPKFDLELLPSLDGYDFFEISAPDGEPGPKIKGSSPIALCRGAYHYARHYCHRQISWTEPKTLLPSPLPTCPSSRVSSEAQARHYLSVCAYGYSMPWWDWKRWEQELDWMALHGTNMPLLLAGTEAVTRRVFLQLGLTPEEIAAHFSGPAYLCWHRLGNLNGHMGPLPETWINKQESLQKRILMRACSLGMRPIVPGFSGFVPMAFRRIRPDVELKSAEAWAGFEKTTYIDPRTPTFQEVASLFLEEYRRTYGCAHHYLCEIFAEQVPCLDAATEIEELREIGGATWQSLASFDPEANWVMQSWPFYFARDYWQPEKVAALLEAVPAGRAYVLDLATEELETWRLQPAMREKGWMFNVVHNYGQNTHLHGDLAAFIQRAPYGQTDFGILQGMGISPEGIDQNPVVYELLTDLMWVSDPIDLTEWLTSYAQSRYGKPGAERAWHLLQRTVYGRERPPATRYCWRYRPGDQPFVSSPDPPEVRQALEEFLGLADSLGDSANFRRDLVDVAKTWLSAITDRLLEQALDTGDLARRQEFFEALTDLDLLLATRPEHCLSTWLNAARSQGQGEEERAFYEINARSLITWWGGPFLFDYATREWSGLVAGFHLPRWQMWFDYVDGKSTEPDFTTWERKWTESTLNPTECSAETEIEAVRGLLTKYACIRFAAERPLMIRCYEPQVLSNGAVVINFDEPLRVDAFGCVPYFGQGYRGSYRGWVSVDKRNWKEIPPYGCAKQTSRGSRFRLRDQPVHSIRISSELQEGCMEQLFQVVVWMLPA